jgi:hypothetical protein
MNESKSWRRGFAVGFVALAVSIAGQVATREADVREVRSCPLTRSPVSERFSERIAPQTEARGLAQRVALAVLGAVLHTCS